MCIRDRPTRYDGGHNRSAALRRLCRRHRVVPVCPEQLGGLSTPRRPAEIRGGDGLAVLQGEVAVIDEAGNDVTSQFLRGAFATLRLARMFRVDGAILKIGQPLLRGGPYPGRLLLRPPPGRGRRSRGPAEASRHSGIQ